jgi:hypothetical protein
MEHIGNFQFRGAYDTLANAIWLLTFFGGNPSSKLEAGSPANQSVYLKDIKFAGSNS